MLGADNLGAQLITVHTKKRKKKKKKRRRRRGRKENFRFFKCNT